MDLASRLKASIFLSNIELSVTKVNSLQRKAIATKNSMLNIAGFWQNNFKFHVATLILFNLLRFMEEAIYMVVMK